MRPTGKPGCRTGLLVKCFQVTCCHVALGSQTTPSGNALKEMGRARAPETRGVTHARKPSSPWRFWKRTAGSGPREAGRGLGHPGNCSRAACSERRPPAWAPAVLTGVARSQVAAGKKGLLGQVERKSPSGMAANPEIHVSICTPATSRGCVAWGGQCLALKSAATETKQRAK